MRSVNSNPPTEGTVEVQPLVVVLVVHPAAAVVASAAVAEEVLAAVEAEDLDSGEDWAPCLGLVVSV